MKITSMLLGILFLSAVTLMAQRNFDVKERLNTLKEKLELNEEQVSKIKDVLEETREEMGELFEDRSGDRAEMREKMTEIRKKSNEEIESLLTEDQLKKYRKYMEEERKNRRGNRPRNR